MRLHEKELIVAGKEKIVESFYDSLKEENYSVISDDATFFDFITDVMAAVKLIEVTPVDMFSAVEFRGKKLILNSAQRCIVGLIVSIKYLQIERELVLFKVNPYVRVFYECYRSVKPVNPYKPMGYELVECISRLNRFVAAVSERVTGSLFRREVSAHMRAVNKNYSGLLNYIDSLFARHSRLLVLRIDFSYGKGNNDMEECSEVDDRMDMLSSVSDRISRHRTELVSYLKNKCPNLGMVGFVWKLEYGREKGHHYHMMFFLDGAKVRKDVVIARWIGEVWNNIITEGLGVYYNCNGCKSKYRFCGVGMIRHGDEEMISNLKRAAIYLTKVDCYISAYVPGNKRTFGKGVAPKIVGSSVGRPRLS